MRILILVGSMLFLFSCGGSNKLTTCQAQRSACLNDANSKGPAAVNFSCLTCQTANPNLFEALQNVGPGKYECVDVNTGLPTGNSNCGAPVCNS